MKLPVLSAPILLLFVSSLLCPPLLADQETDWIELKEGYEGKLIGARVRQIKAIDGANTQHITISIPKNAIADTAVIEEIVVTGKAPKKEAASKLNIEYKWVDDYENDHYGLIITVDKMPNFPIRLYFKGDTETP